MLFVFGCLLGCFELRRCTIHCDCSQRFSATLVEHCEDADYPSKLPVAVEKTNLSEIRKSGSNLLAVKFSTQNAGLHMPS
jgi:hypothetical protein